ncbi:SRPBCC family protein [Microbacterium trichothecenolyticum]|uniref:SRPBCC family protein n=1 Tax=Microbacterium trichothecenolyticum TaxID=69370 RepID=UPI0027E29498|nr:SRPBCC family protein [Microbacterium trichothecenolyticum]
MPSTFAIVTNADVSARNFSRSRSTSMHTCRRCTRLASALSPARPLARSVWARPSPGVHATSASGFTMTSKITELDKPTRFVDQQVRGPFKSFVHEHRFESLGNGCRMTDTITVGSPIFRRLVERVILVPYLRRLITKRNSHLLAELT